MRKMNPAKETIELSSHRGNKNDPKEACPIWRKRRRIVNSRREENQVPDIEGRGKGVMMGLEQRMVGEVPKERTEIAKQKGKKVIRR